MNFIAVAELAFGISLVTLFSVIIAHYYSRKRRDRVEKTKYTMLDDDD